MRFPLASVLAVVALGTTTNALDPIQSATTTTTSKRRRDTRRSLHFAWENTVTPDQRLSFAEFCDQHLSECQGEAKELDPVDMVMRLADDSGRLSNAFSNLVASISNKSLELNDVVNLVVVIFTEVEWSTILGLVSGDAATTMTTEPDGDVDPVHVVEGAMHVMQGMINNSTFSGEDENLIGAMAQSFLMEMYKDNAEIVADANNLPNDQLLVTEDNIRNVLVDLVVANIDVIELGLVSVTELLLRQAGTPDALNTVVVAVLRLFVDLMAGVLPSLVGGGAAARRLVEALEQVDRELQETVAGKVSPVPKGTRAASKPNRRAERQLKKEKRGTTTTVESAEEVAAAEIDLNDINTMEDLSRLVFDELGIDLDTADDAALQQALTGLFGPLDGQFGFGDAGDTTTSTETTTTTTRTESSVFQFSPPPAPLAEGQPQETDEGDPTGIFARFDDAQAAEGSGAEETSPREQESTVTTGVFAPDPDFTAESESGDSDDPEESASVTGAFGGGLVTPPEEPEEDNSSRIVQSVARLQDIVKTLRIQSPILIPHEDHFHEVTALDESLTLLRAESSRFFGRLRQDAMAEQGQGLFKADGVMEDADVLRQFTNLFRIDLVMTAFQGMLDLVKGLLDEEVEQRQDEANPGPFTYLSTFIMLGAEILDQVAPDSPISGILDGLLQVISVLTMFQGIFNFLQETFPNLFGSLLGPRLETAVRVIDTEIGDIISRVQGLTRMTDINEIADTSAELDCRLQLLSCETGLALMG